MAGGVLRVSTSCSTRSSFRSISSRRRTIGKRLLAEVIGSPHLISDSSLVASTPCRYRVLFICAKDLLLEPMSLCPRLIKPPPHPPPHSPESFHLGKRAR